MVEKISEWSHDTVFAAEPVSAAKTRDFVCRHLAEHNLQPLVDDIALVASELATNAMAHAETPFMVTLAKVEGTVVLTVRDGSISVPVKTVPQVLDDSGRGLVVVDLLSRAWGVCTDGQGSKSVWASFPTRSTSGSAPVVA